MKIAVLKERATGEARVAATPDAVRRYTQAGFRVAVEADAGFESYIADESFLSAGASIYSTPREVLHAANLLLTVGPPDPTSLTLMSPGTMIAGQLDPYHLETMLMHYMSGKLTTFSLELLPRISRAQGMDVLSSQSNLAGYRAVVDAVHTFTKAVPMMMTAAGTVAPAKVLVLGAGVAGLQAIATAKRLGAVVSAFDVRAVVKEQVESLGAKFIEVPAEEGGETKGGYAKEMSEEYKRKQSELIADTIRKQDIVISTALIPGRPAPVLITEAMVRDMKPGSVIVDLAAANGGNCPLTEADKAVVKHGITLIGYTNMASRVAVDASGLYARNLFNFVSQLLLPETKWDDELVKGTMLTRDGQVVHPQLVQNAA